MNQILTLKGGVTVRKCKFNENDWAWSTMVNLFGWDDDLNPGKDKVIEHAFRKGIVGPREFGLKNIFANPTYTVIGNQPTKQFIKAARQARKSWFQQAAQILGNRPRAVKRAAKSMSPIIRQLSHTGVLIINEKHVMPNAWPDQAPKAKLNDVTGLKFGILRVTSPIEGCRFLCHCTCGKQIAVMRQTLLDGPVNSCGCLDASQTPDERRTDDSTLS